MSYSTDICIFYGFEVPAEKAGDAEEFWRRGKLTVFHAGNACAGRPWRTFVCSEEQYGIPEEDAIALPSAEGRPDHNALVRAQEELGIVADIRWYIGSCYS